MRKSLLALVLPLLLAGCGQPAERLAMRIRAADLAKPPTPGDNQSFSYMHTLAMEMPRASVAPRYDRARDRCLHDAALDCKLISSSLDKSEGPFTNYNAQLVVALPHEKIAAYQRELVAPVGGEGPGDAKIMGSTTTAQNVTQVAATAGRKVAQLTDYRDRLLALLKRPNLSVDDLIKVEGELSKTQSDLDDALSQKTDVDDRVAREQMSIFLAEKPVAESPFRPIAVVWNNGTETFGENTASALRFLIGIVPWFPIVIAALFLLRWFWRIARRRPSDARSRPG